LTCVTEKGSKNWKRGKLGARETGEPTGRKVWGKTQLMTSLVIRVPVGGGTRATAQLRATEKKKTRKKRGVIRRIDMNKGGAPPPRGVVHDQ